MRRLILLLTFTASYGCEKFLEAPEFPTEERPLVQTEFTMADYRRMLCERLRYLNLVSFVPNTYSTPSLPQLDSLIWAELSADAATLVELDGTDRQTGYVKLVGTQHLAIVETQYSQSDTTLTDLYWDIPDAVKYLDYAPLSPVIYRKHNRGLSFVLYVVAALPYAHMSRHEIVVIFGNVVRGNMQAKAMIYTPMLEY